MDRDAVSVLFVKDYYIIMCLLFFDVKTEIIIFNILLRSY